MCIIIGICFTLRWCIINQRIKKNKKRKLVKRGPKPKGKIKIQWSAKFAYAIGLLTTDGCLSNDRRHITFSSNEREQIDNFMDCFGFKAKIGRSRSTYTGEWGKKVQFGDVLFYQFLLDIGLMPNKTKIMGGMKIPKKYFFDFLRGHLDGDGSFHSYFDPRWKSSFMFYTIFVSASKTHIDWLREEIRSALGVVGHITHAKGKSWYQLKYAKRESLKIIRKMYYSSAVVCLGRKRRKIERALRTNLRSSCAGVVIVAKHA